jgi:2-polyprenyl-6-methoxyphenol hydroxylase-like FAD-dependent oxidoreductase
MRVTILGDGIAAATCAYLLQSAGIPAGIQPTGRTRLPALLLSESSQALFRDIFELDDVFRGLPQTRRRVVTWGSAEKPVILPHSAVVVSEQVLLEAVHSKLRAVSLQPDDGAGWTIISTPQLRAASIEHQFGSRQATVVPVQLKAASDPAACWIESLEGGWLFLLPGAPGSGWLVSVGAPLKSHLENSRTIAEEIAEMGQPAGEFASHPRVCWPLCGERWLACGTAALGFDPLCGDGTGHAIREAILASALVRASVKGENPGPLLAHYEARLLSGFKRHLEVCRGFYESGGSGPWWESAAASARQGLSWCDNRLSRIPPFRYRLNGLELELIVASSR